MTELLSPAGTLKSMRYAYAYGADAVYVGQPRYSLRVRNNEFNRIENLAAAVSEAHQIGKKVYVASNVQPHNDKVRSYLRDMQEVIDMRPDALIMSDPGLIMLVREEWPDIPIHLSVQANAVNWAAVKFWQNYGLSRVILSRELSLDEVENIRQQCPDIELEVFVHGALCIAYSGRCLLSGYMSHRDPNQGACTNSCRWKYQTHEATETETGDIVAVDPEIKQRMERESNKTIGLSGNSPLEKSITGEWDPGSSEHSPAFLLQEENRPGEYMPAYEDEHGTYIMNSRDLRAVQHVKRLVEMGVDSLKIEGRTKSHYYVATTAQVYRRAIEDAKAGKEFNWELFNQLDHLANRGYTEGFYRRHTPAEMQNYERGHSANLNQQYVGDVTAVSNDNQSLTIEVKNKFRLQDKLELITPHGNVTFQLDSLKKLDGEKIDVAPGSGHTVTIPLPEQIALSSDGSKALLMRYLEPQTAVEYA